MGASSTRFVQSFQSQLKIAQKNRKKKDVQLSEAEMKAIFEQITLEYPFMEAMSESAIMTDHRLPDEPIIYANDDFSLLTGYPKEDILGRNCRFLQGKYTDPKTVQQIRDAIKTGSKLEVEILNYRRDGTPFINGFCLLPLHEKGQLQGPVSYFLAIQKNVTVIVNPWKAPIPQWTAPEVCMWLDRPDVQGQAYVKQFLQKDVNGAQLEAMTMERLEALGVVLQSERERLYRLITQEKAAKINQKQNRAKEEESETDVTNSVAQSQSNSDDSADSPPPTSRKQRNVGNSSSASQESGTMRKGLISAEFVGDARPPLPILASTMANHAELRRVLRKKMGRKFEVEKMDTTTGLAQGLKVLLRPTLDGLDNSHFSVLEGVPLPALVTDNVGLIVFANDRAWEGLRLQQDPLDTFVLLHMTLSTPKLDFVSDLRSNSLTATLPTGEKLAVTIQNVQLLKSSLHVWTFVQNN